MALTFVTAVALPSEIIIFGVLHFLAIAAMIYGFVGKFTEKIPWVLGVIIFVLLYAVTLNIPRGYIGYEGIFSIPMPEFLYGHYWLFPLGFVPKSFYSADFYPLLPWVFCFLLGTRLGHTVNWAGLDRPFPEALCWPGRHSLLLYLLHQPVLYGLVWLLSCVHR